MNYTVAFSGLPDTFFPIAFYAHRAFDTKYPHFYMEESERNQANESRTKQKSVFQRLEECVTCLHFHTLTCFKIWRCLYICFSYFCLCEFVLTYYCHCFLLSYVYFYMLGFVFFSRSSFPILGFSGIMRQSHYGHYDVTIPTIPSVNVDYVCLIQIEYVCMIVPGF